jgi:hypothetical protein
MKILPLIRLFNESSAQDGVLLHTNINYLKVSSINNSLSTLKCHNFDMLHYSSIYTAQLSAFQRDCHVTLEHSVQEKPNRITTGTETIYLTWL